jgi:hypothetical protein
VGKKGKKVKEVREDSYAPLELELELELEV